MAIKIIVDSASYITEVEAQEIGITMIPMIISFGGEDFLDGEDISPKQFYEKLVVSKEFPKTAQITPFINTLEYLKKGGRISGAAAMIGTALALKPTVAIVDGEVKNIGKSIGVKRAQTFMLDIVKSKGGIRFDMPHCVIWSGTDDAV